MSEKQSRTELLDKIEKRRTITKGIFMVVQGVC